MITSFNSSTVSTASTPATTTTTATKTISNRFNTLSKITHGFKLSCNISSIDMPNVNRRNLLLGLGGLFGGNLASFPSVGIAKKVEDLEFPVKLDKIVKVLVKRPVVNRTEEDKKKANEILLVNGIKFDGEKFVKFDVFVSDKDDETKITPAYSEFAGSFASLPHGKSDKMMMMTSGVRLGLTELLEDIKAEDDEYVLVTLIPRSGCDDVTVSEIKIELVPIV